MDRSWIHGRGSGRPSYYERNHQSAAVAAALAVKHHYSNTAHPNTSHFQFTAPSNYANNGYDYYHQPTPPQPTTQAAAMGMSSVFWDYNLPQAHPFQSSAAPLPYQQSATTFNHNADNSNKRHPVTPRSRPTKCSRHITRIHTNSVKTAEDKTNVRREKQSKRPTIQVREATPNDCERALAVEHEIYEKQCKTTSLLLRFPDPELSKEIVCNFSKDIENVHFQQNIAPRYCFVQLKEGANVQKAIETISKIPFGAGYVSAEQRNLTVPAYLSSNSEDINPCALFVGNLPYRISPSRVKEYFAGCSRTELSGGFRNHTKKSRHAVVRFKSVEEAIAAFRYAVNLVIDGRFLTIHFWRKNANKTTNATNSADTGDTTNNNNNAAIETSNSFLAAEEEDPTDTKEKVLEEAQKLQEEMRLSQRKSPETNGIGHIRSRRSSLQRMLEGLEHSAKQSANTESNTIISNVTHIKQESDVSEDEVETENLFGLFNNSNDVEVKSEEEAQDEVPVNVFSVDDDVPNDSEALAEMDSNNNDDVDDDDSEHVVVKRKRAEELHNDKSSPTNERSSFVKNLYSQLRRAKENEILKTFSDDDMDDIFARMNSDSEESL